MTEKEILATYKTIAVVGLSPKPDRASHRVSDYMQKAGYRIIPVRPGAEEILGEKAYPELAAIPFPVDIVNVFRRSEFVRAIAEEAVKMGAKVLWLQEGVVHEEGEETARQAGLEVIHNRCILKAHRKEMG
jgi:predicted CoA-binding protein